MHYLVSRMPGFDIEPYAFDPLDPPNWCIVKMNADGVGQYLSGHGLSDLTHSEAENKAKHLNDQLLESPSGDKERQLGK